MLYTDKVNNRLTPELLKADEAAYTVANGYIEMKGCFEEGYPQGYESDRATSVKGMQTLSEAVDLQSIRLWLGEEQFTLFEGRVQGYERLLDIQKGFSIRRVTWHSPGGHTIRIDIRRMASFEMPELLIIDYQVTSIDYKGPIRIESDLVLKEGESRPYRIDHLHMEENMVLLTGVSLPVDSQFSVAVAYSLPMKQTRGPKGVQSVYEGNLKKGDKKVLHKYCIFTDSSRHGRTEQVAHRYMKEALNQGADTWFKAQKDYLTRFWRQAKVEIMGDTSLENAVNDSIYRVMASISKEGLSSDGAFVIDGDPAIDRMASYYHDWALYCDRCQETDSDLPPSIMGAKAVQAGDLQRAARYLEQALAAGLEPKSIGGAFMLMVYGFGGVRLENGELHLKPACPEDWEGYSFRIRYKDSDLKVLVERDLVMTASKPVEVWIYGQKYFVDKALYLPLKTDRSSD